MTHFEKVQTAIEYIENHLKEDISAENVSQQVYFSLYHFHRIFSAIVGESISEYIRKRRLSRASSEMVATRSRIIDIAYDYRFESHEAFTRAFKRYYGITPGKYRKIGVHKDVLSRFEVSEEKFIMKRGVITMEPRIEFKDSFMIVGIEKYTNVGLHVIGESWAELYKRIGEIKNRINPNVTIGFEDYSRDFNPEQLHFYYLAAAQVDNLKYIPEGMVGRLVPSSKYAVFRHKGVQSEIGKTFRYIYDIWLPQSGYELSDEFCGDFEYLDREYDHTKDYLDLDIYLPIK